MAWNDAVRTICGVFRRCHVDTMLVSTGLLPLTDMIRKRKLQFRLSLIQSANPVVGYISSVLDRATKSSFFKSCRSYESLYSVKDSSRHSISMAIRNHFTMSISSSRIDAARLAFDWLKKPSRFSKTALRELYLID